MKKHIILDTRIRIDLILDSCFTEQTKSLLFQEFFLVIATRKIVLKWIL